MSDLSLVINLGSSSLKAALVDSTGATPWPVSYTHLTLPTIYSV